MSESACWSLASTCFCEATSNYASIEKFEGELVQTTSDLAVSKNQQPETPQMASKTCTTLIINPDFNPFSPLQTILESSSTDQSMYDAYASVSDD